jgi:hypothetical protein
MICTYRLRDHLGTHPVATLMMRDMIDRIARPSHAEDGPRDRHVSLSEAKGP